MRGPVFTSQACRGRRPYSRESRPRRGNLPAPHGWRRPLAPSRAAPPRGRRHQARVIAPTAGAFAADQRSSTAPTCRCWLGGSAVVSGGAADLRARTAPRESRQRLRARCGAPGVAVRAGLAGAPRRRTRRSADGGHLQTDVPGYARRYRIPVAEPALTQHLVRIHQRATMTLAPSSSAIGELEALGVDRVRLWARGVDGGDVPSG